MSGNTSNTAVYFTPAPGALSTESILGSPAGRSRSLSSASAKLARTSSPTTSSRTAAPNRFATSFIGALPGRKPGIRTVRIR